MMEVVNRSIANAVMSGVQIVMCECGTWNDERLLGGRFI